MVGFIGRLTFEITFKKAIAYGIAATLTTTGLGILSMGVYWIISKIVNNFKNASDKRMKQAMDEALSRMGQKAI